MLALEYFIEASMVQLIQVIQLFPQAWEVKMEKSRVDDLILDSIENSNINVMPEKYL